MMNFEKINKLKMELDALRPLPAAGVKRLDEVYLVEWTYNSNAIEGNTLTLLETKMVLEEGLTIGGKKLREHFEVINHAEAIHYVKDIVDRKIALSEHVVKSIHQLVLRNIDDEHAGRYRTVNVGISGSKHTPPHFTHVPQKMAQLIEFHQQNKEQLHPVELAAQLHFQLVYIHPFTDGNGRTARLLMNLILMREGFPPAIIKAEENNRLKYYEVLEEASVKHNLAPFIRLVAECVEESLQRYIAVVK